MIQKIRQYFCKHTYKCVYIYGTYADWRCLKCEKKKKGFAPVGLTQEQINNDIINRFKKSKK